MGAIGRRGETGGGVVVHGVGGDGVDPCFDPPPRLAIAERRLAGRAVDAWIAGGGDRVAGFDDYQLLIADPGGLAWLASVGSAIAAEFGMAPGQLLARGTATCGLGDELVAACDRIALAPQPVPIEASIAGPHRACLLVRGVAVPVDGGRLVQAFVNWRTLLDPVATERLRVAVRRALGAPRSTARRIDPFSLPPAGCS